MGNSIKIERENAQLKKERDQLRQELKQVKQEVILKHSFGTWHAKADLKVCFVAPHSIASNFDIREGDVYSTFIFVGQNGNLREINVMNDDKTCCQMVTEVIQDIPVRKSLQIYIDVLREDKPVRLHYPYPAGG